MQGIDDKIKSIILEYINENDDVSSFKDMDSLEKVELLLIMEEELEMDFPDDTWLQFTSLESAIKAVKEHYESRRNN